MGTIACSESFLGVSSWESLHSAGLSRHRRAQCNSAGAATLGLAGAFQFSSLQDRCLTACRHPAAYLRRHYRRGPGAAFRLGWGHGLYCLGCCWALMLVMFAVGVSDLRWMAALAGLMAYEKIGRHGQAVAAAAGVVALALALLVALHPVWLPPFLTSRM